MSILNLVQEPMSHGRLLDIIRSDGPISRVEIAQVAGLTTASVSNIVRSLLDNGLVLEVGQAESTGGKRRTMLEISPGALLSLGVHLGPDTITYALSNMAGGLIGRERKAGVADQSPEAVVERVATDLEQFTTKLGVSATIAGVGVVAGGPIDVAAGALSGLPSPEWATFALRDRLAARTGMTVIIDKDATGAAIGEFWGAKHDVPRSFACVYLGAGIGSGIVTNGSAFRGGASNAGEVGHISLNPHGEQCWCGNRGCVETVASARAVVARARREGLLSGDEVPGDDLRMFDSLARRAVAREPAALEVITGSAEALAEAVLTLVNITDVDLVVLAGPGFAIAGAIYAEAVKDVLGSRAFMRGIRPVGVRLSTNPRDAAALGASAIVLQQSLAPRQ